MTEISTSEKEPKIKGISFVKNKNDGYQYLIGKSTTEFVSNENVEHDEASVTYSGEEKDGIRVVRGVETYRKESDSSTELIFLYVENTFQHSSSTSIILDVVSEKINHSASGYTKFTSGCISKKIEKEDSISCVGGFVLVETNNDNYEEVIRVLYALVATDNSFYKINDPSPSLVYCFIHQM